MVLIIIIIRKMEPPELACRFHAYKPMWHTMTESMSSISAVPQ